jgi:hypothetical protein
LKEGVEAAKAKPDTVDIHRLKNMTFTFIACRLGMMVPLVAIEFCVTRLMLNP